MVLAQLEGCSPAQDAAAQASASESALTMLEARAVECRDFQQRSGGEMARMPACMLSTMIHIEQNDREHDRRLIIDFDD